MISDDDDDQSEGSANCQLKCAYEGCFKNLHIMQQLSWICLLRCTRYWQCFSETCSKMYNNFPNYALKNNTLLSFLIFFGQVI